MKLKYCSIIIYILFAIPSGTLLAGGDNLTIVLRSGKEITGELLTARKDILLISRQSGLPDDSLESHPDRVTTLKREEIKKIIIAGKSWVANSVFLGLVGGIACWGIMAEDPGRPPTGLDPAGPGEKGLIYFGLGGIALGVLVGVTSSTKDRTVDAEALSSLIYLKQIARYKDEEPDFIKNMLPAGKK